MPNPTTESLWIHCPVCGAKTRTKVLLLYYFGGFTLEKIAEMEGCKHPAISKSIRAAEKNLKSLLQK